MLFFWTFTSKLWSPYIYVNIASYYLLVDVELIFPRAFLDELAFSAIKIYYFGFGYQEYGIPAICSFKNSIYLEVGSKESKHFYQSLNIYIYKFSCWNALVPLHLLCGQLWVAQKHTGWHITGVGPPDTLTQECEIYFLKDGGRIKEIMF